MDSIVHKHILKLVGCVIKLIIMKLSKSDTIFLRVIIILIILILLNIIIFRGEGKTILKEKSSMFQKKRKIEIPPTLM